jgi:hypothetical protein
MLWILFFYFIASSQFRVDVQNITSRICVPRFGLFFVMPRDGGKKNKLQAFYTLLENLSIREKG